MTHLRALFQACFAASIVLIGSSAQSHEFWIDPIDPTVEVGTLIKADIRVGEMMKGSGLIYNPKSFTDLAAITPDGILKIPGRLGDRPALNIPTETEGLYVIAYMTTANRLKYKDLKKFETFAQTHGQDFAIETHKDRGLPDADFTEAYFRCAKALVKVGSGIGEDQTVGFPFELTALNNPYTDDGSIRFVLTYKGEPKADHQVDVFHKTYEDPNAVMTSYQTDEKGEVSIPRETGDFLVNAVVLEVPKPSISEKLNAVWVSLWASTTYTIE